jgi:hypothetical protein
LLKNYSARFSHGEQWITTYVGATENLVVDRRSLKDGAVEIGCPIRKHGDFYLVEFPRETMSGSRRVWVHSDQMSEEEERVRA